MNMINFWMEKRYSRLSYFKYRSYKKLGLQLNGKTQYLNGITVYASDYFNPYDAPTGILEKQVILIRFIGFQLLG